MKSIKQLTLTYLFTTIAFSVAAQFQGDVYRQYTSVPVMTVGGNLDLAFSGGVNNPHLAMADLNRDGRKDLVIFEKYSGTLRTFISRGPNDYYYDPSFEANFPEHVYEYMKIVDFNRDQIPDFVHRGFYGISVSYGYWENNRLKFKFFKDLFYQFYSSGWVNASVNRLDIPIIHDIDGDGDLDILSYDGIGFQITQYKNCTVEDGLPNDSIRICIQTDCWGHIREGYTKELVLGHTCVSRVTCKGCAAEKGTDGSNAMCAIDIDSDGDYDFFNGNANFSEIVLAYNGKAQYGVDSIIAQDTSWGSNGKKVFIPVFPAAFYLNIDNEGADDLVFIPNMSGTENYNSIVFYKNTGTNSVKNFVYQSSNYLVDKMIDLGSGSYPLFYDVDKDGRKDLLIGSDGFYDHSTARNYSKIAYFKNTSATGSYSFELISDDYLGLGAMKWEGAALAAGDLDNDTLDDLVIGRTDGTLAFFKNVAASPGDSAIWQLTIDSMVDGRTGKYYDVGNYAVPCIFDVSGDNRKDLVVGNQLGHIMYMHNYSSISGVLGVEKKTDSLGGVKIKNINDPYPYAAPYIGTTDDSGEDYLVVGTNWGKLYRYSGIKNGPLSKYTLIDSNYSYVKEGQRITPAFANVDNDPQNLHEMVVGSIQGGVKFYKQDFKVSIRDIADNREHDVQIYPNPASTQLTLSWNNEFNEAGVSVQLVSVTGQTVLLQSYGKGQPGGEMNISNLASGVYYCILQSAGNRVVKPVTVLK